MHVIKSNWFLCSVGLTSANKVNPFVSKNIFVTLKNALT